VEIKGCRIIRPTNSRLPSHVWQPILQRASLIRALLWKYRAVEIHAPRTQDCPRMSGSLFFKHLLAWGSFAEMQGCGIIRSTNSACPCQSGSLLCEVPVWIRLFCGNVGLFCGSMRFFCGNVGLIIRNKIRLFLRKRRALLRKCRALCVGLFFEQSPHVYCHSK